MNKLLVVRANVFLDDIGAHLRTLGQQFDDAEHVEEVVRRLVRLDPYEAAGLPAHLRPILPMLREPGSDQFCVVHEVRAHYSSELQVELGPDPGPVFTLPVAIDGSRSHWSRPAAGDATTPPRRPYPHDLRDALSVDALVAALTPRVTATIGGVTRLEASPLLAPLCSMAMSVVALARCAEATHDGCTRMVGAALDALDLGPHRHTAERILIADDKEHIPVDVREAPTRFLHDREIGLALLVHDGDGSLVLRPAGHTVPVRVLRALMTEPL